MARHGVLLLSYGEGAMAVQINQAYAAVGPTEVDGEKASRLGAVGDGSDEGGELKWEVRIEQAVFCSGDNRQAGRQSALCANTHQEGTASYLLSCETKWSVMVCRAAEGSPNWLTMSSTAAELTMPDMAEQVGRPWRESSATTANNCESPELGTTWVLWEFQTGWQGR